MFFYDLIPALLIALAMTAIFPFGFRGHRGVAAFFLFFVLIFLATWAVGIWVTPLGARAFGYGYGWISFLITGILFALLITAVIPPARRPRSRAEARKQARDQAAFLVTFNFFFWVLVIGLLVVITVRYLYLYR
jgi:uncharacterized membrane protein